MILRANDPLTFGQKRNFLRVRRLAAKVFVREFIIALIIARCNFKAFDFIVVCEALERRFFKVHHFARQLIQRQQILHGIVIQCIIQAANVSFIFKNLPPQW